MMPFAMRDSCSADSRRRADRRMYLMTTIKDVAKLAKVSQTTVSLVLGGRADEFRIPQSTRDRVTEAVSRLNYQPNLSARRLRRSSTGRSPVIAFYWPQGDRLNILSMFLDEFQRELQLIGFECEFVIQMYRADCLEKNAHRILNGEYHAVIIGGASVRDIEYLDSINARMPVVVINRQSAVYSSVAANNWQMAELAAELFLRSGYKKIGIIGVEKEYTATNFRIVTFTDLCRQGGAEITMTARGTNSLRGGAECAERLTASGCMPEAILAESSTMALGAIYSFVRAGISVPDDAAVMAFNMSMIERAEFFTPSLTVVDMPSADIAKTVIDITVSFLRDGGRKPVHISFDGSVHWGESFPQTGRKRD